VIIIKFGGVHIKFQLSLPIGAGGMSEIDLFKLDGLIIRDNPSSFIIKINYNLPIHRIRQAEEAKLLFGQIKNWMSHEFWREIQKERLYYCISATCTLVHDDNDAIRLWQGSFQPRNNQRCLIKDSDLFQPNKFEDEVFNASRLDNVVENLRLAGLDTKWTVGEVKSIIVNFETRCSTQRHTFEPNSQIIPVNRLRDILSKRYTTFTQVFN